MIKKLILKNIQSHAQTALEFDPGINCIIGSSNAGKSAILRALYWVRYNRPLGIDVLASHWALNDKGALKDEISVQFENGSGAVIRRRTKTENQYILQGQVLNVVKSDVPAQVETLINLTDVNIQKQLDQPFLLSQTSGEIARYFNKIVRLDIIDKVLGNAESTRRKLSSDIEVTEEAIKRLQDKLVEYDFLPIVERLLDKYNRVEKKRNELTANIQVLQSQIHSFEEALEKSQRRDFKQVKEKIMEIEQHRTQREVLKQEIENLQTSILCIGNIKIYPNFSKHKDMIEKLISYKPDKSVIDSLRNSISMFERLNAQVENHNILVDDLKSQLPEICPLCGNVMERVNKK